MSERKVLNKYIPPNFDPSKIPKKEGLKDEQHKVRLMAPFSMRCGTCGDYIYKGRKFNARKETVHGEKYLSIRVYRFYIRCPRCSAEITFKTDPKNADYVAENGATRNFEPWREEKLINEELAREREKEEEFDPMKALENRTMDSKREIDILEGLDEIRTHNARLEKQDADNVRETLSMTAEEINQVNQAKREKDEDDVIISQVFASSSSSSSAAAAAIVTKRLLEDEDKDKDNLTLPDNEIKSSQMNWGPKRVKNSKKVGIIKITNSSNASSNPKAKKKQSLVSYSSSDEVD